MGRRGPAPTPTQKLKLRGSWRADRNPAEPKDIGTPEKPDWLSEEEGAAWHRVAAALLGMGVLTQTHQHILARYATAFVRWQKAVAFIREKGEVYTLKDDKGRVKCVMPWPQVVIAKGLAAELAKLEQEMGLTPASRTRIVSDQTTGKPEAKTGLARLKLAQ